MVYKSYIPQFPLSKYVEFLWFYEGRGDCCSREAIFTDGRAEVIINLSSEAMRLIEPNSSSRSLRFADMVLCGPHTDHYALDMSSSFRLMGVVFRPYGAASFLPVPTGDVFGARVPGDAIWGTRSGSLRERLHDAGTLKARFRVLEAVFLDWLERSRRADSLHPVVPFTLRELHKLPHARRIESLRDEVGLSPRRFIRLFRDSVGMPPKVYARIQRFQGALRAIDSSQTVDWVGLALDCGYYDQPHFIRDFQAFSSFSPSVYAEARRKHLEHIPEGTRQFFTICAHGS